MKREYIPFKFYKLKLYQQIILFVFFLLLVIFSLNMYFVRQQMDDVVNRRQDMNADMVASSLSTSPNIIKDFEATPIQTGNIALTVNRISEITKASIVIFDKNENIITVFNPTTTNLLVEPTMGNDRLTALKKLPINIFKSNNAKPIKSSDGKTLGYVLVAYPKASGNELSQHIMNILIVASAIGLSIGIIGSLLLAYSVKKTLFGFEPLAISQLLDERTTLLNTVKESIIVTDPQFNIRLLNTKAQEMLEKVNIKLPAFPDNEPFKQIAPTGLLQQAMDTGRDLKNIELDINGLATLGDIIILRHENVVTGLLVSLNEKNSVQAMAERLSGVTNYADALRARTHEFMNKMHVIKGLLYTKDYTELQKYVENVTDYDTAEMQEITDKIKSPILASFLIAKKSRSHELQVNFTISEDTNFPEEMDSVVNVHDLIVIIGNLLENSFDVLKKKAEDREVLLEILPYDEELVIVVSNNGEAIGKSEVAKIFQKGYTTKGKGHGYGLALLQERLEKLHGNINVDSDNLNGTEFTVQIPLEGELKND